MSTEKEFGSGRFFQMREEQGKVSETGFSDGKSKEMPEKRIRHIGDKDDKRQSTDI